MRLMMVVVMMVMMVMMLMVVVVVMMLMMVVVVMMMRRNGERDQEQVFPPICFEWTLLWSDMFLVWLLDLIRMTQYFFWQPL